MLLKPSVAARVSHVQARSDHGEGAASITERRFVGRGVDALRETGDHGGAKSDEGLGDPRRVGQPLVTRPSRAHDRDLWAGPQQVNISGNVQNGGCQLLLDRSQFAQNVSHG